MDPRTTATQHHATRERRNCFKDPHRVSNGWKPLNVARLTSWVSAPQQFAARRADATSSRAYATGAASSSSTAEGGSSSSAAAVGDAQDVAVPSGADRTRPSEETVHREAIHGDEGDRREQCRGSLHQ